MTAFLLSVAAAFALLLPAELPDKTTLATLVLTTRFSISAVLTAACGAFAIQTLIAVAFGGVVTLLPDLLLSIVVIGMFGIGAALLLYQGYRGENTDLSDQASWNSTPASFRRGVLTSFGMLFAAEWGDASQLATMAMVARSGHPLAVGVGAFLALFCVTVLAAFLGQKLRKRLRPRKIQQTAGWAFAGCAALALVSSVL